MSGFAPLYDSATGRSSAWKATDDAAHVVSTGTQNITTKFRDAFETYDPVNGGKWIESLGTGDLVYVDGNAAAASYLVVSKNPLVAGTETAIESILKLSMPIELGFGGHMSQRTLSQAFAVEIVDTGTPLEDVPELAITAIQQATTTLTVTTELPHNLSVGKSIGIRGVLDSRVSYPSLVVASVPAPNQFTVTAGPGGTIASLTAYTASVLASTTAALPANVYANGTAGVGATLTASANGAFPAQDGVTIPLNGRLLVRNEATGANNGVYVLTQVGSAGTPWILTRATDYDTAAELTVVAGALFAVSVFVEGGATNSQKTFYLSATVTTVGTTDVTWVDSGRVGPLGFVFFRERLGRANNGASIIFENSTVTNASLYIRSESGDALPSGTVGGNHSVTIGTTASIQIAGAQPYTFSFSPTNEFRMVVQADRTQWSDGTVDSATTASNNRLMRSQVCPDPNETYKLRIRATNNKSMPTPLAQIVSAVKSGSTTATINTDRPHGLFTGDIVQVFGIQAQGATEFPNLVTPGPVLSTPSATQFTVAIGTAGTITSYGGVVVRVNGGIGFGGLGGPNLALASAALTTLVDGTRQLTVVASATWVGAAVIGDLVELIGVRDNATGATLNVDGPWKVANIATTTLTLVLPYSGQRTLPADFGTIAAPTNCGGAAMRRTDLRLSFIRIFDFARERVELLARPSGDVSAAAPVTVQNSPSVTVSSGSDLIGNVGVQYRTSAAGLATTATHFVAAGSTNATLVKNAAGKVFGWFFANTTATWRYVKLHNQTTTPTAGSGVVRTIGVPPNGVASFFSEGGITFTTGIGLTMVTGAADADATAVTANDLVGELFYA